LVILHDSFWKGVGKILVGCSVFIGSIVTIAILPWALPLEAAILGGGILAGTATFHSFMFLFRGIIGLDLKKDVEKLLQKLENANNNINALNRTISDVAEGYNGIVCRLNAQDATKLSNTYDAMNALLEEIRKICLKCVCL
jgi:hypothetical protein